MAHIEDIVGTGEDLRTTLMAMDHPELIAQQITQQGAMHALETLLTHGCTVQTANGMLASLRSNMQMIEAVTRDKGFTPLFADRPNDAHDDLTPGADSTDRAGVADARRECSYCKHRDDCGMARVGDDCGPGRPLWEPLPRDVAIPFKEQK